MGARASLPCRGKQPALALGFRGSEGTGPGAVRFLAGAALSVRLCQETGNDLASHVGKAEVAALEFVGQFRVIEAEQLQ